MRLKDLEYTAPVIFLKYESKMWPLIEWRDKPEKEKKSSENDTSDTGSRVLQISDAKCEESSKILIFPETYNPQGKYGTLDNYWLCPVCDPCRSLGDHMISKTRPVQDLEGNATLSNASPWDKEEKCSFLKEMRMAHDLALILFQWWDGGTTTHHCKWAGPSSSPRQTSLPDPLLSPGM